MINLFRLLSWPFTCRIFGHVWIWEPNSGIRPFCGACLKPISTAELAEWAAQ